MRERMDGESFQSLSPKDDRLPPELDEPFDAFWKAYPSRGPFNNPKRAARVSYLRAILRDRIDPETLTMQANAYKVWCRIMGWERTSFVAMAVTWLNQCRWEADYSIGYHLVAHLPTGVEREMVIDRINEYMEGK